MKKKSLYIGLCVLLNFWLAVEALHASKTKYIRVGRYWAWVCDSADEGKSIISDNLYSEYHAFTRSMAYRKGWTLACRDWIDPDGVTIPIKVTIDGTEAQNENYDNSPVPDEKGLTLRRYRRYAPPTVTVDGRRAVVETFPVNAMDEINPAKIPGTADICIESTVNTSIGVTIHQRVFAWSQRNHDEYIVWMYTLKNTGLVNLSGKKIPNQTLKDLYFLRTIRSNKWHQAPQGTDWHSAYGEHATDSLRMVYYYSSRAPNAQWDNFGAMENTLTGFPLYPQWQGEAIVYADKSPLEHVDDFSQPQMTDVGSSEEQVFKNPGSRASEAQIQLAYKVCQFGFKGLIGAVDYGYTRYLTDSNVFSGTHHAVRFDDYEFRVPEDNKAGRGHHNSFYSFGPYQLAYGDSLVFIWASVHGSISAPKAAEFGQQWAAAYAAKAGTVTPPPGCDWNNGAPVDNLPSPFKRNPAFMHENKQYNWAKDCWIATGKDSLFRHAAAAQWAARNKWNIPTAPPAPSVTITSLPDKIQVHWDGSQQGTEAHAGFAGYRVYRALGSRFFWDYATKGGNVVGLWSRIFECGKGTSNPAIVHTFADQSAEAGKAYFYYVAAFDDGTSNGPDVWNKKGGAPLESGPYLNMSTVGAYRTVPAGDSFSDIRIVPNPFNISAQSLQYPGEPNKIMFVGLPLKCTIRIYSQSGDLVKSINHYGSGVESWGTMLNEHSVTNSGQMIVSGVYLAVIETPEGKKHIEKFVVVR
jgi:hypothetical protein